MNKQAEILDFLKKLMLGFLDVEESKIVPEAMFTDLGVDSLDLVEVQVSFDKTYGVQFASSIFASGEVKTVGDFVDFVATLLERKAA